MGRVSKYKKIKAVDPFSKKKKGKAAISSRASEYVWGSGDNGRREKKRSLKARRHQARKLEGASDGRRRAREAAGAGGFDLPPSGKDDFDLTDLVGSVRRQKRPRIDDGLADTRRRTETVFRKSKGGDTASAAAGGGSRSGGATQPTPSIPETDAEEKRVARILKLSKNSKSGSVDTRSGAGGKGGAGKSAASSSSLPTTKKESKSQISGRREGESMRAFERRVKEETRLILLEQASKSKLVSKEKVAKKKEFLKSLKSKKKNRKGGGGGGGAGGGRPRSGSSDDEYGSDDGYGGGGGGGLVTGERAVAAAARAAASTGAAIHDQVERPPTFELLPRGATRKATKKAKEGGKLGMDEQKRRAEQRAMDNLRLKVQAQYNVIKQKRKRAGDFHL